MKHTHIQLVKPDYSQVVNERALERINLYNAFRFVQYYAEKAQAVGLPLSVYCERFGVRLPKLVQGEAA